MKSTPMVVVLSMLAVASVSVAEVEYKPLQECVDLCKKTDFGTRRRDCEDTCTRCTPGVGLGYLPHILRASQPDCQKVCSEDQVCTTQCKGYQESCCHAIYGCCPNDARLCV
ncbi:hypothetical protein V8E36_009289 [Tilletia maclaganii]